MRCFGVLSAVQFDDQLGARAKEIRNVRTDGLLTAKAKADEIFASKHGPKSALVVRHVPPQVAGAEIWQMTPLRVSEIMLYVIFGANIVIQSVQISL